MRYTGLGVGHRQSSDFVREHKESIRKVPEGTFYVNILNRDVEARENRSSSHGGVSEDSSEPYSSEASDSGSDSDSEI